MQKKVFLFSFLLLLFKIAFSQTDSLKGGELYSSNFLIDNIQRNFTYYMPVNYGTKDLYPLAIFLHAQNSSAKNIIKSYGSIIHAMADTSGCIVIYPDAVAANWNTKMNETTPATDSINDVGFISILIDYFRDVYHCDAKRVYVAGFANGGEFAYRLACDIPFKIAAISPYILQEVVTKCKADPSVAVMNTNNKENPDRNDVIDAWKFFMLHVKE